MIAGCLSAVVLLINSWLVSRTFFISCSGWMCEQEEWRARCLPSRRGCSANLEDQAGFGRTGAKPRKAAHCLKTGSGLRTLAGFLCHCSLGNSRCGVQGVVSELVKRCTAHLYSPTPLVLNGKNKASVRKNLSGFSHI